MSTETSEDMSTDEARAAPVDKPVCKVDWCTNKPVARGWCTGHYQQWRRTGSAESTSRMKNQGKKCSVTGCPNKARATGLCNMHYTRKNRTGEVGPVGPKYVISPYERAMVLVDTSAGPGECHLWTGSTIDDLPVIRVGSGRDRTFRSARRVIAEHHELLGEDADQSVWVRMSDTCDPLCCNIRHMEATTAGRPGTKGDT